MHLYCVLFYIIAFFDAPWFLCGFELQSGVTCFQP
jgi:hypothetical protein